MNQLFFSLIIPVYNRPDEINELLQSLTLQSYKNFEVIIVEDGSKEELRCERIVEKFKNEILIKYFFKENSGQGFTRNYAFERASGDFFIIFDSDIIVPPQYLEVVNNKINLENLDAFGGPDAAAPDFNNIQKAISYSMTSIFTTGGIRGNKKHAGVFHPRSFNMGISRKIYKSVGGFIITRMAEDLEYSIRIIKSGFNVALISEAYVFHKRRSNFVQFYKQLYFFGRARINLSRFYPNELKIVHFFPMAFTLGILCIPILFFIYLPLFYTAIIFVSIFTFLIFIDASIQNKNLKIGSLSVVASFTQLLGYGFGFIEEGLMKIFRKV